MPSKKNHPIHKYLSQLSLEDLSKLYLNIFKKPGKSKYEQMRKSLAKEMFSKFPKAPLTTLIWIETNQKVPTDIEFDIILKEISSKANIDKSSKELNDQPKSKDFGRSTNEKSPEGENNILNKKCNLEIDIILFLVSQTIDLRAS